MYNLETFCSVLEYIKTFSLVHTCRKNRGFSPSQVCERICERTSIWEILDYFSIMYRIHLISSARRRYSQFLRQVQ